VSPWRKPTGAVKRAGKKPPDAAPMVPGATDPEAESNRPRWQSSRVASWPCDRRPRIVHGRCKTGPMIPIVATLGGAKGSEARNVRLQGGNSDRAECGARGRGRRLSTPLPDDSNLHRRLRPLFDPVFELCDPVHRTRSHDGCFRLRTNERTPDASTSYTPPRSNHARRRRRRCPLSAADAGFSGARKTLRAACSSLFPVSFP
jgi:hypothetical protein